MKVNITDIDGTKLAINDSVIYCHQLANGDFLTGTIVDFTTVGNGKNAIHMADLKITSHKTKLIIRIKTDELKRVEEGVIIKCKTY